MNNHEKIEDMKNRLIERETTISVLNKRLSDIEKSLVWRFLIQYEILLSVLFPEGTFIRKHYNTLIKINQDKKRGFFRKYKKYYSEEKNIKIDKERPSMVSTNKPFEEFIGNFPIYKNPMVSIIVLTHNKYLFMHQCLDSVLKNTDIPYEVIVIDNASRDKTHELFSRLINVRIEKNMENVGFSSGVNQGAKLARGKYLLLLNSDTIVTSGWLSKLVETAESDKKIATVGPKIMSFNKKLQSAGAIIWKNGQCGGFGCNDNEDKPIYSLPRSIDYGSASCLLIKKEIFEEVGGFDERYHIAYYEDADFGLAITKRGYINYYEPSVSIYHNEHTSSTKGKRLYYLLTNRKIFMKKWGPYLLDRDREIFRFSNI